MRINRTTTFAGLFAGIGAALWTLFEFAMGWHGPKMEIGAMTGFVGVLFPLAAIIWALRTTKSELGGRLSLGQALLCGLSVSLILAAFGILFYYLYYTVINPDFIPAMQASGAKIDMASQLISVVAGSIVFSMIVALIGGLIMRTRRGSEES